MQFTQPAHGLAIELEAGTAAGVQGRMDGRHALQTRCVAAQQIDQVALHVVEIDGTYRLTPLLLKRGPPGSGCQPGGLLDTDHRQVAVAHVRITHEYTTQFEHTHAALTVAHIVPNVRHQTTNETAAHHCQLAGNRVQQADRIVLAGVITLPGLFDKRKIDDFLIVERGHAGPQLVRATQSFGLNTHLCPCTWGLVGNSLEAVDTGHFLDEIFFNGKVEAVAGGLHLEDVVIDRERQPQAAEDVFHFGALERQAQYTAAAFETHAHRLALRKRDDLIIERAHLATANVDDESGHVL